MKVIWRQRRDVSAAVLLSSWICGAWLIPAQATVLNFEFDYGGAAAQPGSYSAAGNSFWVPDEYGDRVNGIDQVDVSSDDFGGTDWYTFHYADNGEGFTPNVIVEETGGLRHWSAGYGNLSHAAYFSNNGYPPYVHYHIFTADTGFNVTLNSLQIDRYTGADASVVTVSVYAGNDPQNPGTPLFTSGPLGVNPGDTKTITPNVTSRALMLAYEFEEAGSFFSLDYWATDNIIFSQSIAPGLPGDFNSDNKVDAGDYVTWKKNEGTNNALANDNALGTPIGNSHYNLWRSNFGNPPGSGGGAGLGATAVPEPSSLLIAIATVAVSFAIRRR